MVSVNIDSADTPARGHTHTHACTHMHTRVHTHFPGSHGAPGVSAPESPLSGSSPHTQTVVSEHHSAGRNGLWGQECSVATPGHHGLQREDGG